jgi:hypothetical protein
MFDLPTYHGAEQHWPRHHAERMSKTRSVARVPPCGWISAATAGTMAMNTGLECSHEESSDEAVLAMSLSRAVRKLSVEDRVDNRELRRRGVFGVAGRTPSAKVEARFNILCRSCAGIWASPSARALSITGRLRSRAAYSRESGSHVDTKRQHASSRI